MIVPRWFRLSAWVVFFVFALSSAVPFLVLLRYSCSVPIFVQRSHGNVPVVSNVLQLCEDTAFLTAVTNTVLYATSASFLQVIVGLTVAVLVHSQINHAPAGIRQFIRSFTRTLFMTPYFLLTIIAVEAWWKLAAGTVPLNLNRWIDLAFLCLVSVWQFSPFVFALLLAALDSVSRDQEHVVELESRFYWHKFRFLLWPRILRYVVSIMALRFVWMATKFETAYYVTGHLSVTSNETMTLPVFVFKNLSDWRHREHLFWRSATIVVLMVICEVGIVGLLYLQRRRTDDDAPLDV